MEGGVQMDAASQEMRGNTWFSLLFRILRRDRAARESPWSCSKGGSTQTRVQMEGGGVQMNHDLGRRLCLVA